MRYRTHALRLLACSILAATPPSANAQQTTRRDAGTAEKPGRLVGWGYTGSVDNLISLADDIPKGRGADDFIQISGIGSVWGALREDGEILVVRGVQPNLRNVEGKVIKISVSVGVTAALDDGGKGYIWAGPLASQIPPTEPLENLVDIGVGVDQGYALTTDGRLIWWGAEKHFTAEFAEKLAPFQGNIGWMAAGGYGCSLVTRSGEIVAWGNYQEQYFITRNNLSVAMDPPAFDSHSNRICFRTNSGGWRSFGAKPDQSGETPVMRLASPNWPLTVAESASGEWTTHGDGNFLTIAKFQTFLDENRPAALLPLGQLSRHVSAENRTLGALAIVPGSSTLPAAVTSAPGPTPAPAMPVSSAAAEIPTNHGITDPRFLAQLKLYEAELLAKAQSIYETSIAALNTKLDAALEREEQKAIKAGDLDRVTTYRAEREHLITGALPASDPPKEQPTIVRFRNAWRTERAKIDAQRILDASPVREAFEDKLAELETTLTREENIDEALKVRAFRESLAPGTPE